MKKLLQDLLASLSRRVIKKYRPTIIGITGSMGKTSTKEAIFNVVSQKYRARRSEKNFNNEFGLPLTVLGSDSPAKSPFKWLALLAKAGLMILSNQKYPQILVLEMGVDRPGDMDYLLSIVRPNIAILTGIGSSHMEFFKDTGELGREKGKIASLLGPGDTFIVNADNAEALKRKDGVKGKIITYGIKGNADISPSDIQENLQEPYGTQFSVIIDGNKINARVKALGESHLSALIAACAVAQALKIEKDLVLKGLQEYKPAPGRLNIITGIKHSVIIDDTYNSSPDPVKAALRLLRKIPSEYKIAVLGDMLVLGNISVQSHREIGEAAAAAGLSRLVTVGPGGKIIAEGAAAAGFNRELILCFDTADEAKKPLQELMRPGSLVLIKGSQGMRMEKITKEVMAEPMRAPELLCRQYGNWLKQ